MVKNQLKWPKISLEKPEEWSNLLKAYRKGQK
jgi:hypothetical protein